MTAPTDTMGEAGLAAAVLVVELLCAGRAALPGFGLRQIVAVDPKAGRRREGQDGGDAQGRMRTSFTGPCPLPGR